LKSAVERGFDDWELLRADSGLVKSGGVRTARSCWRAGSKVKGIRYKIKRQALGARHWALGARKTVKNKKIKTKSLSGSSSACCRFTT
jgi:hypothetical protein